MFSSPVQRFFVAVPTGKKIRGQPHVARCGKLGCQVQRVLDQPVSFVSQDDRPYWRVSGFGDGKKGVDPVAKRYRRGYSAGVVSVLNGLTYCGEMENEARL